MKDEKLTQQETLDLLKEIRKAWKKFDDLLDEYLKRLRDTPPR